MEIIKNLCMQYFSEIQNFILFLFIEREIKQQLLAATSKEEIQEILKDIPKLSIINLKKDLENEKEIALYDLEILLLKNRENKGDK